MVLIILFGYGLSKWSDGAKEGIEFYLTPDIKKLGDINVWYAAAIQIFYKFTDRKCAQCPFQIFVVIS